MLILFAVIALNSVIAFNYVLVRIYVLQDCLIHVPVSKSESLRGGCELRRMLSVFSKHFYLPTSLTNPVMLIRYATCNDNMPV